jgi:type III restriction enzyme
VNAEKVIVKYFNITIDETDKANDLKKVIAKLLKINILIDEVRHATADDIKLTQAINYWNKNGNLCAILGFSGTPYLPKLMVI